MSVVRSVCPDVIYEKAIVKNVANFRKICLPKSPILVKIQARLLKCSIQLFFRTSRSDFFCHLLAVVNETLTQGFESRWMSVELICYVKPIIVFYRFYDLFCRRHSLMNRPCYDNLFQFVQHDNFLNLDRVIFTH